MDKLRKLNVTVALFESVADHPSTLNFEHRAQPDHESPLGQRLWTFSGETLRIIFAKFKVSAENLAGF
jgi:hypothetical protein